MSDFGLGSVSTTEHDGANGEAMVECQAVMLNMKCCLVLGAVLAAFAGVVPAPVSAEPLQPVTLEIVNDEPAAALRCVVMLAHFVSVEAGPIAPGGSLSLPLGRVAADASLTLANAAGKPMMVENVVCGASGNWAATRADVSLLALRDPATRRLAMRCRIDGRLGCRGVASAE